jgi:hypothetical protein
MGSERRHIDAPPALTSCVPNQKLSVYMTLKIHF